VYLHTKNKLSTSRHLKVTELQTDRHRDAIQNIIRTHAWMVTIIYTLISRHEVSSEVTKVR